MALSGTFNVTRRGRGNERRTMPFVLGLVLRSDEDALRLRLSGTESSRDITVKKYIDAVRWEYSTNSELYENRK